MKFSTYVLFFLLFGVLPDVYISLLWLQEQTALIRQKVAELEPLAEGTTASAHS